MKNNTALISDKIATIMNEWVIRPPDFSICAAMTGESPNPAIKTTELIAK